MSTLAAVFFIIATVFIFQMMQVFYKRYRFPLLIPVATTTFIIVICLLLTNINYETYMIGGSWIGELLGPGVVALAFPLYQNRQAVKQYFIPIFTGVFVGSATGIFSGFLLARFLKIDEEIIYSIIPKSVTTPVAMDIAKVIGGIPSLAAVYVMIAGISGGMIGPYLLKVFRIDHFIGVGLGFGSASHGVGTAKALEIGTSEAAVSSIAMIISAMFAAILCPIIFIYLF